MSVTVSMRILNVVTKPLPSSDTLNLFDQRTIKANEINDHIQNCAVATHMRKIGTHDESRPHLRMTKAMRRRSLIGGILLGRNKIVVPPLTFTNACPLAPSVVQILYLGQSLCGYPGMIHGGLLATILDEGLARACSPALPNKIGLTASFGISYKRPCLSNVYVVLRAETTKVEGRKAWGRGSIEYLDEDGGNAGKLVEAEALFIEPHSVNGMTRAFSPDE